MAAFQVFHHSEAGGHAENQDAFALWAHPRDPDCLLCAVADGQGGQSGAAQAAQVACRAAGQAACALPPEDLLRPDTWPAILRTADQVVMRDNAAGFTSLAAFGIRAGRLCGASSGDSGMVVHSAGTSVILTGHQFKNPPVGSGEALFVPFAASLTSSWSVLALTDGVWKYAGWENVLRLATQPGPEIIAALRQRAALPGSGGLQDDFTLVVIQG